MNALAETAMLSYGWRRILILLLAGALAGLSVPPLYVLPALFIGLPVWIWCLDGAEKRHGLQALFGPSFTIGFSFGLGYFLVSIHWVGAAFFVDGGWFVALMPFAVLALAAVLALFWAFASVVAHFFWSDSAWRILAFGFALSLFEFARGNLFSGFPFNLVGYGFAFNDQMSQIVSLTGIYGLTLVAILVCSLPAFVWPKGEQSPLQRILPIFLLVGVMIALFSFGQYRMDNKDVIQRTDIKLRLVQPAIAQSQKWNEGAREQIMQRLMDLSETRLVPNGPGLSGVTYLVWPEAAIPFYLTDQPEYLARIGRMLPLGKNLISGAPRKQFGPGETDKAFNSIMMINSSGEITASYDKTHLVPIGEYLPFENLFSRLGIKQFVPGIDGWSKGDKRRLMSAPGAPAFLPLICYEAVFSGALGEEIADADFILNLTNDAWFDGSIGPAQHFAHARLRAVEEGRSLVRLANSGISALVDPLGRVTSSLRQGEAGVLDVVPPRPLEKTFFSTYRNWPFFGVLALMLMVLGAQKLYSSHKKI